MSAKTCARCGEIRPASAFPKYDPTRCRICRNAAGRDWKANNLDAVSASASGDPIEFSRAACKHVASYLGNAKEAFEQRTGTEAPPFIDAILSVTQKVLREHPVRRRCTQCGAPISNTSRSGLCRQHGALLRHEQTKAKREAIRKINEESLIAEIQAFAAEHDRTPRKKDIFPDLPPYWLTDWTGVLHRAGLASAPRGRPWRPVDLDGIDGDIVRLYTQGHGYKSVAAHLGLTRNQVRDRLRGKLYPYLPPRRRPSVTTLKRLPERADGGPAHKADFGTALRALADFSPQ